MTYLKCLGLLVLYCVGFSVTAIANQNYEAAESENYYVDPTMIYLAPNGIFLNFEGECFPISTLCSDSNGIYVPSQEMSRRLVWCPICQRWREPGHTCSSYK
jgi:hypothetical protein